MMKSDINKLFNRLKFAGNLAFLIGVVGSVEKLLRKKTDFPTNSNDKQVYLFMNDEVYALQSGNVVEIDSKPESGYVIMTSRETIFKLGKFLNVKPGPDYMNRIFIQLKRAKNIKKYKDIIAIVEDDFQTNMSISDITHIIITQL
ncbi:hypothetical protein [Weissella ceti]|nr:hypothetical protein [Weissella ceti]QVK11488.1 hypothetical protein KHQ31_04515 [Weissella ceti]